MLAIRFHRHTRIDPSFLKNFFEEIPLLHFQGRIPWPT